jgi:BolA protein
MSFFKEVEAKIIDKLNPDEILIIDKSKLHTKHKSFKSNKFYLKIIIKSEKLKNMSKINSHKTIYSLLKNEIKEKIHALEIEIN